MISLFCLLASFFLIIADPIQKIELRKPQPIGISLTRRIIRGNDVADTRPYMVYLRPSQSADAQITDTNWMCGGVIIHERFILTSAACIEDVKHFYIVSGTHRWVPFSVKDDECINNGAKKAVWKCVPKSYIFDGSDFDNIRWMMNDIAIVKVEDEFNFNRRVRGCEFTPTKIAFNNVSDEKEKPGTVASIAGWGSTERFGDIISRTAENSPTLLETDVQIISKKNCKKRWDARYHRIIDEFMICGKDGLDADAMSVICSEQEVNCKELVYSDEAYEDEEIKRRVLEPSELEVHSALHKLNRRSKIVSSGFCENDHGGPLVVGQGKSAVLVGIISACQTKNLTNKCYGPFLYTSVFLNRNLINCAIDKEIGQTCKKLLRMTKTNPIETTFNWSKHPDGPAKADLKNWQSPLKYFRSHDEEENEGAKKQKDEIPKMF